MTPFERAMEDHRLALESVRLLRGRRKGGLDAQVEILIQRKMAAEALARAKAIDPDAFAAAIPSHPSPP